MDGGLSTPGYRSGVEVTLATARSTDDVQTDVDAEDQQPRTHSGGDRATAHAGGGKAGNRRRAGRRCLRAGRRRRLDGWLAGQIVRVALECHLADDCCHRTGRAVRVPDAEGDYLGGGVEGPPLGDLSFQEGDGVGAREGARRYGRLCRVCSDGDLPHLGALVPAQRAVRTGVGSHLDRPERRLIRRGAGRVVARLQVLQREVGVMVDELVTFELQTSDRRRRLPTGLIAVDVPLVEVATCRERGRPRSRWAGGGCRCRRARHEGRRHKGEHDRQAEAVQELLHYESFCVILMGLPSDSFGTTPSRARLAHRMLVEPSILVGDADDVVDVAILLVRLSLQKDDMPTDLELAYVDAGHLGYLVHLVGDEDQFVRGELHAQISGLQSRQVQYTPSSFG